MKLEIQTTIDGNVVTKVGSLTPLITIYRTKNDCDVDFYFVNSDGGVMNVMHVTAHMSQGCGYIDDARMIANEVRIQL